MRSLSKGISVFITISALTHLTAGRPVEEQLVLSSPDKQQFLIGAGHASPLPAPAHQDSSPSLFASVYGLLRNWPEAFAPNGWNIVPGYIPVGTQLYHGADSAAYPTSGMEWFAFDPEHAYPFAVMDAGMLHTFVATAPLPVLYFDGFSAAKGSPGRADLQDVIVHGNDTSEWNAKFSTDRPRSQKLCDWAQQIGFGGVIRLEACFELIWCDFSHSVEHVRAVNATTPIKSTGSFSDPSAQFHSESPRPGGEWDLSLGDGSKDLGGPPRPGDWGPIGTRSLYWKATDWRILSAASTHFIRRDPRIILSIRHLSSLHGPKYGSIRDQYALPNYKRRLLNISGEDASEFKREVENNCVLWRKSRAIPDGPDYAGIVDEMVQRKTLEFQQIKSSLDKPNVTEAFLYTKVLAYGGLFTYLNGPEALNTGADAPSVERQMESLRQGVETCATALIAVELKLLSSSDRSLSCAIGNVQRRICEFEGFILLGATELESKGKGDAVSTEQANLVREWRQELENLSQWLKWPTMVTCPGGCDDNEICVVPMWPLDEDGKFNPNRIYDGDVTPRCVGWELLH